MKNNMTLKETIYHRINNTINEDYGINDEFDGYVDNIANNLLEIAGREIEKRKNGNPFDEAGRFTDKYGEITIHYDWSINFYSGDDYQKASENNTKPKAYFLYGFFWVNIPICIVDGKLDRSDFYDSLHHEMEHFFQTDKMGKNFGEKTKAYEFAASNLYSENELIRNLSTLLYCNEKTGEQDAMINGLWGDLKNNARYFLVDDTFDKSEACAWLKRLYSAYNFFKKNEENETVKAEYYALRKSKNIKYSYESLKKFAYKNIRSFERKIGRVIYKFKKERLIKESIRIKMNANGKPAGIFGLTKVHPMIVKEMRKIL